MKEAITFIRWAGPPLFGTIVVYLVGFLIGGPWTAVLGEVMYTAGYVALIRWHWT